jgi:hypothetical protein
MRKGKIKEEKEDRRVYNRKNAGTVEGNNNKFWEELIAYFP